MIEALICGIVSIAVFQVAARLLGDETGFTVSLAAFVVGAGLYAVLSGVNS